MKRNRSLYKLSHDHHHGLKAAQLIKKDAPHYKNLPDTTEGKIEYITKFYEEELVPHFFSEEKILFKRIKGRDKELDNLISKFISEHKLIANLVELLYKNNNKTETLDVLGKLLSDHIRNEERILFPKIQLLLSEKEAEEISQLLEKY